MIISPRNISCYNYVPRYDRVSQVCARKEWDNVYQYDPNSDAFIRILKNVAKKLRAKHK